MEYSEDEEYQRSAIGRFYYACFGVARDYYEKRKNKKLSGVEPHKTLIESFEDSYYEDEEKIGHKLRKIRTYRNYSDYGKQFRKRNVIKSKKISQELFSMFDDLSKNNRYD